MTSGHRIPFRFDSETGGTLPAETLVVRLPRGIVDRGRLFDELTAGLSLPAYFGRNWDALDECLRTLEWFEGTRTVVVRHADVPFRPRSSLRRAYLDLLRTAAESWKPGDPHELIVSFPPWAEPIVRAALR